MNNECAERSFPVSLMNSYFKAIFQVKLPYQLDELCLPGDLTINLQSFPVSLMNGFVMSICHIDSKFRLLGLNNECAKQSTLVS